MKRTRIKRNPNTRNKHDYIHTVSYDFDTDYWLQTSVQHYSWQQRVTWHQCALSSWNYTQQLKHIRMSFDINVVMPSLQTRAFNLLLGVWGQHFRSEGHTGGSEVGRRHTPKFLILHGRIVTVVPYLHTNKYKQGDQAPKIVIGL